MSLDNNGIPTFNDAEYMVNNLDYSYNDDAPPLPANKNKCMTKEEVEALLSIFISGSYSNNQLVPYGAMQPKLNTTPPALYYNEFGGVNEITITTPNSWMLTESIGWITTNKTSGFGNDVVSVTATKNNYGARTGSITITDNVTSASSVISVSQAAATTVETEPVTLSVPEDGAALSCIAFGDFTEEYYVDENANFNTAVNLYANNTGTIKAQSGWYSNGTIAREWNGNAFIGSIYNC